MDYAIEQIDFYNAIQHRLYVDHLFDGKKDLSKLNRTLSRIILLDSIPTKHQMFPDNSLSVRKWEGHNNDRALLDIVPLISGDC